MQAFGGCGLPCCSTRWPMPAITGSGCASALPDGSALMTSGTCANARASMRGGLRRCLGKRWRLRRGRCARLVAAGGLRRDDRGSADCRRGRAAGRGGRTTRPAAGWHTAAAAARRRRRCAEMDQGTTADHTSELGEMRSRPRTLIG